MKLRRIFLLLSICSACLATTPANLHAQSVETYQQMSGQQRSAFVAEQARRIAREMSGRDYQFTPAFEAEIQKAVDACAQRIGNNGGDRMGSGDARFIFERGQAVAPTLIPIFKAREVSPLFGLYIPL